MVDYTILSNNFTDYKNRKGFEKAWRLADSLLVGSWFKGDFFNMLPGTDTHHGIPVIDKEGDKDMEVTFTIRHELTGEEFNATVIFTATMDYDYNVWREEGERDHYSVDCIWFKDIDNIRLSSDRALTVDERVMILDMFTGFITKKVFRKGEKA